MSTLRALIVDGDRGFTDRLQGWLAAHDIEVVVSAEWSDALGATVEPSIVFIGIDAPDQAGFSCCERARAVWPGARIVLAAGTVPLDEMDLHGAHACLDKRTLTRQELHVTLDALIGPLLGVDPGAGHEPGVGQDEPEEGLTGRLAELEEEVRSLRWELDETRLAAQSAPFSRDFLRLADVVGSKEKDVVRLKKEIWARDHKIATSQRTLREASARALVATREREAAVGHAAQLQKDLEAEQAEARRLRLDVQRQGAEAEHAVAGLVEEQKKHEETRRQHEIALAALAEVLKQVKEDQLRTRSALETQLREEKGQAVAAVSAEWKRRVKGLRRKRAHSLAILHDRLRDLEAAHRQELSSRDVEHQAAAARQREELQRLHELSLAVALAAHADAERRAEHHRSAQTAAEARLQEERAQAVAAAAVEWERQVDDLRRAHADSVGALRKHFQVQLGSSEASQEQERAKRESDNEAALQRSAEELAAARTQAAQLDVETRQHYELELAQVQARHLEALTALETRLREEKDQALAASVSEWEAKLDELRRAHAGSVDALRRSHLEQLGTLQASGADDLAAARTQALQLEQESRRRFELELAQVRAGHLDVLLALETRLREEKDKAIAATVAAWEGRLDAVRREDAGALETLRGQFRDQITSLQAAHEQAAVEQAAAHQAALAEALARHFEAERRSEQDHRSAQSAIEERAVAGWEGKLDELRRGHAGSLDTLRRHYLDQLGGLQTSGAHELARRDGEHQAALRRAAEELADARTEAAQLEQETRQRYELELVRAEARHLEALNALETRLREEKDQAVAAAVTAWTGRLEELRSGHAASVDTLRREHQDQLTALRAGREQELAQTDDEHEAALRRLNEELAAARSKAAQPGPAQLLARHAEATRALEARLREEKDQAVAAAVAEWKAKMERLRRGHADSLAALRREHQDQLLALEAAHEEGLPKRARADQGGKVVPLKAVTRDRSS